MPTEATLAKARLRLVHPTRNGVVGDRTRGRSGQGAVEFRFNPKEYTIQKAAQWERQPNSAATPAAVPDFRGAQPASLSLEMFFDATVEGDRDVNADVEVLFDCCTPTDHSLDQDLPTPPWVVFEWGAMSFVALVKSVSVRYSLFGADGTPLRATATVQLEEAPVERSRQNPTSGGLATLDAHTVVAGDSLASVAYREYGDPALWRALAEANGVDDPLRVPTGTRLLVPPPAEAAALAARPAR